MRDIKCIVPVSGGKDSQCCLKLACEEFGPEHVLGLFCDTRFEHPKTYQHVQNMKRLYGVRIKKIQSDDDVISLSLKYKRFPGGGARFCTDQLKIRMTKFFLKDWSLKHGSVQVWYGMRVDESAERAKRYAYRDPDDLYPPHVVLKAYPQYLAKRGVMFRLPICDWVTSEVMEELEGHHNPLYDEGFDRVGCFPCLASGDKWKIKAFEHDDFGREQLIKVRIIEDEIGKSVFTSKIGQAFDDNSQGCRLCEI